MRIYPKGILTLFALVTLGMAAAPASAGEPNLVEVPLDIDVYDHPGGEGKPRGQFLKAGSQVDLLEENADHWCHVAGAKDPVPGGSGWIWCGKGDDKKDYRVKSVKADMTEPTESTEGDMTEPTESTESGTMESPVEETPESTEPTGDGDDGGGAGGGGAGGGGE
jgi:hypothetical protein